MAREITTKERIGQKGGGSACPTKGCFLKIVDLRTSDTSGTSVIEEFHATWFRCC